MSQPKRTVRMFDTALNGLQEVTLSVQDVKLVNFLAKKAAEGGSSTVSMEREDIEALLTDLGLPCTPESEEEVGKAMARLSRLTVEIRS